MSTEAPAVAPAKFTLVSRLLHWSMAIMVIGQFFLGVTMVAALAYYPLLLAIHRVLGTAILVFAIVRLINRLRHHPPAFLATMGPLERKAATWSERLMYALLVVQPLIGWAMISASDSPVRWWDRYTCQGSPRTPSRCTPSCAPRTPCWRTCCS